MANTVSKVANTGIMYTKGEIDELSINPNAQGSISFNGSSQYLSLPASSAFAFGTGDFTIECWVNPTTAPISTPVASTVKAIYGYRNGADTLPYLYWAFTGGVSFAGDITTYLASNVQLTLNVWTHIAVVRIGTAMNMYINGTSVASNSSVTQNFSDSANVRYVGFFNGTNGYYWPGNISNLRIVNGVGVYTGAFTPPTQQLQKLQLAGTNIAALTNSANTSLLLNTLYNNAFIDSSDNNFTVANTASPTSTPQQPFNPDGNYSYNTNTSSTTSGAYITAPANVNYAFGTGDFTVEAWVYITTAAGSSAFFGPWTGTASTSAWVFTQGATATNLRFGVSNGSATTFVEGTGGLTSINKWIHIAAVRISGNIVLYSDGVSVYSGALSQNISVSSQVLQINGINGLTFLTTGYISNVRVVKGVGVYTGTFTPPTTPLRAIQSAGANIAAITGNTTVFTSLLTCQSKTLKDNGANNVTLSVPSTIKPVLYSNTIPFSNVSFANSGLPVSKHYSNGALQIVGSLDEVSLNTNMAGSVSFNGTTQYLVLPLNEAFNIGTGDFTFDAWIMPTNATIPQWACIFGGVNYGSSSDYVFQAGSGPNVGNYPYANFTNSQADNINSSVALVPFKWQHIALSRKSGVTAMFIDGVLTGTYYNPNNSMNNTLQKGIGGGYNGNVNTLFPGYISNVRLVKGLAVYSGIWNSPTTALTTTSQNATAAQVSLLTAQSATIVDNSTNAFTITNNNTVTSGNSIIPFASTYSYQFNGTSQYLTVPNNAAFQFGTGEFTVECWVYPTAAADAAIYSKRATSSIYAGVSVHTTAAGFFAVFLANAGGTAWTISNTTVSAYSINTWYHIVVTKKTTLYGSHIYFYVNGSLKYRGTMNTGASVAIFDDAAAVAIGAGSSTTPSFYFPGYISNLRVVKGTALYQNQTIFTPPSRSLDTTQQASANIAAITNKSQVSLLLETAKLNYIDTSLYSHAITKGGTPPSSVQSPFLTNPSGYFSNLFNGTSQYLSVPNGAVSSLGTATDFTLEAWIYPTTLTPGGGGLSNGVALFGAYGATGTITGFSFFFLNTGALYFSSYVAGTQQALQATNNFVTTNSWQHVAITRSGSTYRMFVNGVSVTFTGSITQSLDTTNPVNIGGLVYTTYYDYFTGYISNARIVKGTAVYTSNFTPSTSPLTAITNTYLLTCQSAIVTRDNSTNVFTITNTGTVTAIDNFTPFTALANTAPTITSGTTLRKQYDSGNIQIINQFDESTGTA